MASPQRPSDGNHLRISAVLPISGHGKPILAGVVRHLERSGVGWSLRPANPENALMWEELEQWQPHGVLVQSGCTKALEWCSRTNTPYVLLLGGVQERKAHELSSSIDDMAVGRIAAEYFLNRGYQSFAFVGNGTFAFSLERQAGFEGTLRAHGRTFADFIHSTPEFDSGTSPKMLYHAAMADWLSQLAKPVAVMAADDWEALALAQACGAAGLKMPEEVSLLGVGDDKLICSLCRPEVSSVKLPFARIGSEAAELLLTAIRGNRKPKKKGTHLPLAIITRGSSDGRRIVNPVVREAIAYMQAHMSGPMKIAQLLKHLEISRPNLERQFKDELGHTPLVELQNLRIERARMLLADTELTNAEIAARSGFASNIRFITVFKKVTGVTPAAYREDLRFEEAAPGRFGAE